MKNTTKQNYTEKVTLRLTSEDKQNYQNEADNKKVPLTTLLRNKINGVEIEAEVFEPKLIHYQKADHNRKQHLAQQQLKKFEKIKNEASKYIEIPTTNEGLTLILANPLDYVTNQIDIKHRPSINIPISKEKLLGLLEIDLSTLQGLLKDYKGNYLTTDKNVVKTKDFRREFEHYTSNEDENKRLELSLRLIDAFSELTSDNSHHQKPHNLIQATNNKLRYDNGLIPSLGYVKQSSRI
jgi:hypothetical protein